MNDDYFKTKSRRLTPWTGRRNSTPLESYIDLCTGRDYDHRHPAILDSGEAACLNTYELPTCRLCGSENIVKDGFSETGIRRNRCKKSGRRFTVITNTIFDSRKLPVSERVCFCWIFSDTQALALPPRSTEMPSLQQNIG